MRMKISKRYFSYTFDYFSTNLFYMFPVTVLAKLTEILKFKLKKKLTFSLTWNPMGVKSPNCYSQIYEAFSTKLVLIFETAFPIIILTKLRIGVLKFLKFKLKKIEIFLNTGSYEGENFITLNSSYSYEAFFNQPFFFLNVPCDGLHRSFLFAFSNFKFKF